MFLYRIIHVTFNDERNKNVAEATVTKNKFANRSLT
jgi:hypothetical protein